MLSLIRDFFEKQIQSQPSAVTEAHALQLATAALLVEMMRMDEEIHEAERNAVIHSLQRKFGLSNKECAELVDLAEAEAAEAHSYYQFTRLINDNFTAEQKVQVIEYLWEVAFADRAIDIYEEHLVRKLSELLYVPHREFIAAKHRVQERLGIADT